LIFSTIYVQKNGYQWIVIMEKEINIRTFFFKKRKLHLVKSVRSLRVLLNCSSPTQTTNVIPRIFYQTKIKIKRPAFHLYSLKTFYYRYFTGEFFILIKFYSLVMPASTIALQTCSSKYWTDDLDYYYM